MQVIDEVHYRNHTDPCCLSKYNPAIAKEKHPNANFVVAEQTFSWLYLDLSAFYVQCQRIITCFIYIEYALGEIGIQKNVINLKEGFSYRSLQILTLYPSSDTRIKLIM